MEHSKLFFKIKSFYDKSLWTAEMVHNAVLKGIVTELEYNEIITNNQG